MINNHKMLNEIRKGTDMGIVGIDCIFNSVENTAIREVLTEQRKEYQQIYNEADRLLESYGGKKRNISPFARYGAMMASRMKQTVDGSPAKVAEMMVEGNTRGLIKSYRCRRELYPTDPETRALADKLMQTEVHNIEQMKQFL